jgi:tetratricopeptide (TPR) repeat protein
METALRTEAALPPARDAHRSNGVATASTEPLQALAMIAQQRAAYARQQRWKRGSLALVVIGVVAGALVIPRLGSRGTAAARAAVTQPPAPRAVAIQAQAPAPAVAPESVSTGAVESAPDDPAVRCQNDFAAHQWRAARESCGAAFEAAPSPALAMRIAHAHWAYGDAAGGGTWGQRALELGTKDADAYVLIGHAQHAAGDDAAALAAYRRYLELAPRGWHAARLRTVVKQLGRAPAAQPQRANR